MKNYRKPVITTNESVYSEVVSACSGGSQAKPPAKCPKAWWQSPYEVTFFFGCKGECPYYQHVDGWGKWNDICTLNN